MKDDKTSISNTETYETPISEEVEAKSTQKQRKKRFAVVAISLITIFGIALGIYLLATNYNPFYYIDKIDGQYYMISRRPAPYADFGSRPWHGVHFDSVSEIKTKFIECDFTDEELSHIQALLKFKPGQVAIPDLDNLCEPILPEDIMWGETVSWSGSSSYSFTLYHNMPRLSFSTTTKSYFQKQKDRLTNYTGDDLLEVTRVEHIEDRNATVYYTRSKRNGYESSFMTYTILSGDREYIVAEHNDKENESSNYIQIWMRDGNYYGYVYLEYNRAKDRPSITWLSSFGLTPCK